MKGFWYTEIGEQLLYKGMSKLILREFLKITIQLKYRITIF